MKPIKRLNFSIPLILLISLYTIIIFSLVILKSGNDKNFNLLAGSIDTLSKDNSIIPLLYNANSELSISENDFRIYLSTEDSNYKKQFLKHINTSISYLEEIRNSKDSIDISKAFSGLAQSIQLADAIIILRKFSDSILKKDYSGFSVYNNPLKVERINNDIFNKYITTQTDTLKTIPEKKSFIKKLGSLFSNRENTKFKLIRGSNDSSRLADSITNRKVSELNNLAQYIRHFYQKSIDKELKARRELNESERMLAESNLLIIDNINSAIGLALHNMLQQKSEADKRVTLRINDARNSIKAFSGGLSIIVLIIIVLLFLRIRRESQIQHLLTRQAVTEKSLMERKLLQSQMDPHFVFNALISIQSFILKNNAEEAIKYLSRFSKLMRQILVHSKASSILLDDEIATLENYIVLQQLMLDNQFDYVIEDNGLLNNQIYIPPMLIQPFVENAVEHGLKYLKERRGRLIVSFEEDSVNRSIICKVEDNGLGIEQSKSFRDQSVKGKSASMAIKITEERMHKMYVADDSSSGIEIVDKKEMDPNLTGTLVRIKIPII